jgi:hypothetical protein
VVDDDQENDADSMGACAQRNRGLHSRSSFQSFRGLKYQIIIYIWVHILHLSPNYILVIVVCSFISS